MNKVYYGIKNVHYAKITVSTAGVYSYGTPVPIPGAVSMSLSIAGGKTDFYADNTIYNQSVANNGYTGNCEFAKIPDQMLEDVFGYSKDTNGVLTEDASKEPETIALLWQFEGDENEECYVAYNVKPTRPGIGSSTTKESKEPGTQSCDIAIMPALDPDVLGKVVAKTGSTTSTSTRAGWFGAVYTG